MATPRGLSGGRPSWLCPRPAGAACRTAAERPSCSRCATCRRHSGSCWSATKRWSSACRRPACPGHWRSGCRCCLPGPSRRRRQERCLGRRGIGFCASATPPERASTQAAIVDVFSMLVPPLQVRDAVETSSQTRRSQTQASLSVAWHVPCGADGARARTNPPTLERRHLQSLPRARRDDGAADLRDAGPLDGAADRRRHHRRSRHRSGVGRRLCRHRRRRGFSDDNGLRRIDRALWRRCA